MKYKKHDFFYKTGIWAAIVVPVVILGNFALHWSVREGSRKGVFMMIN